MSTASSPYKGLAPFEGSEHDVQFFFGRDRDQEIITANLLASRLTVLYGETGVGKSSILRAGVAHNLRSVARRNVAEHGAPELAVVVFDSWRDDPVAALTEAVADAVRQERDGHASDLPIREQTLGDHLNDWAEILEGNLYIILDGFEEYFLYHEGEEGGGTFMDEFPEAVRRSGLQASFLLSLREDALARLDRFKATIPNLFGNYLRLEHLDRAAAREAIVRPIEQYNRLVDAEDSVEVEPRLVEAVLDEVAAGRVDLGVTGRGAIERADGGERVETPYLQLVMQRLWEAERSEGSRVVRLTTLRRLGGAEQIVRDHLELALESLGPAERNLAAEAFEHLVTPGGTKIAHAASDLARYAGVEEQDLLPVLSALRKERVLRSVATNGGGPRYEIYHDVLADAVLAWRAAHETERELARQRDAAERRHRRLLFLVGGAALLVLVMAAVTVYALAQRSDARSQARLSRSRELAATADAKLEIDPALSLALAVQAAQLRKTAQAEDVLRRALTESHVRLILPHGGPVTAATFSRDGRLVLTASEDGGTRVWATSVRLLRRLDHGAPVNAAAFSPDGRLVVTAGADGTARIWRHNSAPVILRHKRPVTAASFSPDGRLVLTASEDATARLWNAETGDPVRVMRLPGPVTAASFSRDGRLIVTVGSDQSGHDYRARIWMTDTGRLLRTLEEQGVTAAAFNPDGRLLVTGSQDHTAQIWDVASGRRLHQFTDQQGGVTSVSFGPSGHLVVTTSSDGATRVFDVRTGLRVALILGHVNTVLGASFSPNGKFLVTVSSDGTARVWEAATGRFEATLRGDSDVVSTASFSPDGSLVITGSRDGTARLWDPGTVPELRLFARGERVAIAPDGRHFVVSDALGLRVLDGNGHVVRKLGRPVHDMAITADGARVIAAGEDGVLRVIAAATGEVVRSVKDDALDVAVGGDLVAVARSDSSAQLLRASNLRIVRILAQKGVTSVALSRDGRMAATGTLDGTSAIRSTTSGAVLHVLRGHTDVVNSVEFSRDGRLLATASRDHDARVWDVATGAQVTLLRGHFGPVFGASFSPDSRWVVTAGPTTAGLWPVDSGRLLRYLHGPSRPLTSAVFSTDGKLIVTASRDGNVRTYRCEVCGGAEQLVAAAKKRLARIGALLTPAQRARYLGEPEH